MYLTTSGLTPAMLISAAGAGRFLKFIAELREMTARGDVIAWHAETDGDVDLSPLFHLCPPSSAEPAGRVTEWRESYRPGLRYYRRGPGFVVAYDHHPATGPREVTLTIPSDIALFDRLHSPGAVPAGSRSAARLRQAGLLFDLGCESVVPIGRLRRLTLPTNVL
ncbi:MAG TPA: DUF5825 family protein [Streptosporangiaceae bacterium]